MIDVRIFGVPERIDNITKNKSILGVPDNRVVIDSRHDGCSKTAKKAWGILPSDDHVLVLQDDIELCDSFLYYCGIMIDTHPNAIISLYPGAFPRMEYIKSLPRRTPYISTKEVSGQAIIMPSKYIDQCLASWSDDIAGDDIQIRNWSRTTDILRLTTIPCIVQHIGHSSVFDHTRDLGSSDFFVKDPSGINWREKYFTSETNVAKR